tara:strand:+ start:3605 stop:3826 length:222 start_codon:yes stop_codon:yes gene_type:complete
MNTYGTQLPLLCLKFADDAFVKFCRDVAQKFDDVQLGVDLHRKEERVTCHAKYVRVAYVCLFGVDVDDSYRSP